MEQDEEVVVDATEKVEPTEAKGSTEHEEPQEDYRGKLNATNRFLEKEGYAFDTEKKQWSKPASPAPHPKPETDLSSADKQWSARVELNSLNIRDRDKQDFIIAAAKRMGVDPWEAATDEFVVAKLEKMDDAKRTKDATPAPSRGSGPSRNTKLPNFSKMSNAEFDKWERENR